MSKDNNKKEIKRLNQCTNVQELKKFLESSTKPTSAMDAMLIKGGKLGDLVNQFKKQFPDSKDFQTPSKLKAHIRYRESKGFVFEEKDDAYFKLKKIS